ncbi:MAG: PVC-type heme-binding CxxCH protein, partial [Verrucomicrobiota bacterium]
PVAFATDNKGRWYVSETFRLHAGASDIRAHMDWLEAELASTTSDSWLAILNGDKNVQANMPKNAKNSERLQLLWDSTGSGHADKSTIFAEGMNGPLSGIASGVLARKGKVYLTSIPELLQFEDTKGTGVADVRKTLASGFGLRTAFLGHDLHGLRVGPDGRLYFTIGDRGANAKAQDGSHVYNPETGAVFRCNQDGSELEIFAQGLRNPQELAFDEFGNLFTGDNNSDAGDPARFVYILQGGDSGWRIGWQFLTQPPRGPWLSERFCYPSFDGQSAHHIPPVSVLGNGPSGLTYNPGTGLAPSWRGHFFLADFRGSPANSGIHSFSVKPKGAGFELSPTGKPIWNVLATDVEFGVDGGLYVCDWVNGWGMPGKGRIYRVTVAATDKDPLVLETKTLLAEGMEKRTKEQLVVLLGHADMRVRQEAQFELADRSDIPAFQSAMAENSGQLARLHAIWGLGQIARVNAKSAEVLIPLLKDKDAEVRAQAAKTLGDLKTVAAAEPLTVLLKDPSPRVCSFAAIAVGRIGHKAAAPLLLELLGETDNHDPVLRYAAVSGLMHCASPEALVSLKKDTSPAVRIGAINALRRLKHAGVSEFLDDADPVVLAEAVRAIHDESIEGGFPKLAALLGKATTLITFPTGTKEAPGQRDAILRRVINANFRQGQPYNAQALVSFANLNAAPESLRDEALTRLAEWAKPSNLDKVMGLYRPLGARDAGAVVAAASPFLASLLNDTSKAVQISTLNLVNAYGFKTSPLALFDIVKDVERDAVVRVEALKAMATREDTDLGEAVSLAAEDSAEVLRKEATKLLVKVNPPGGVVPTLISVLKKGSMGEKQSVLTTLGELTDPAADAVLLKYLDELLAGKLASELQLELLEAAAKRNSQDIKERLKKREDGLDPKDPLAAFRIALSGGDAAAGRKVFMDKPEASCFRCHKVNNEGGEVGPVLSGVGSRQTREYLLESIVEPNAKIAAGFESAMITLKDGSIHAGILKKET